MLEAVLKCAELEEAMAALLLAVAARSHGARLQSILTKNAEEERGHARVLRDLAGKTPSQKVPIKVVQQAANRARQAREMTARLAKTQAPLMPADALQVALSFEEWCAEVYAGIRDSVSDPVMAVALSRIGEEELEHCRSLQAMGTNFM